MPVDPFVVELDGRLLAVAFPFTGFEDDCSEAVVVGEPDLDEDNWLGCFWLLSCFEDCVVAESGLEGCLKSALTELCLDSDLDELDRLVELESDLAGLVISLR